MPFLRERSFCRKKINANSIDLEAKMGSKGRVLFFGALLFEFSGFLRCVARAYTLVKSNDDPQATKRSSISFTQWTETRLLDHLLPLFAICLQCKTILILKLNGKKFVFNRLSHTFPLQIIQFFDVVFYLFFGDQK